MSKTYPETKNESTMAAEPAVAYAAQNTSHVTMEVPTNKDILATTMSVDAYFDELISLVHKDYANL